jgi:IMP dehydrogenase
MPYMKLSNTNQTFTFDDVQIIPQYSDIASRSHCNTSTLFTENYHIDIPLIASPMASICELKMAYEMWRLGGVGIIHRFNTIEEQSQIVSELKRLQEGEIKLHDIENRLKVDRSLTYRYTHPVIAAAIGAKEQDIYRARALLESGANVLVIDIAHGHHLSTRQTLEELKMLRESLNVEFDVIAGNIATARAVEDLEYWGANALRVGIGGGSVCETRVRTGVGIPQVSCLHETAMAANTPIISCGGTRYPGDVAKALVAGASSVILGSMVAGTDETPGEFLYFGKYGNRQRMKIYHGSASDVQKTLSSSTLENIEGTATTVPYKGSVETVVNEIMDGVRSAMSYVGAETLEELYTNGNFVSVTSNGLQEAMPHLL